MQGNSANVKKKKYKKTHDHDDILFLSSSLGKRWSWCHIFYIFFLSFLAVRWTFPPSRRGFKGLVRSRLRFFSVPSLSFDKDRHDWWLPAISFLVFYYDTCAHVNGVKTPPFWSDFERSYHVFLFFLGFCLKHVFIFLKYLWILNV